MKPLSTTLKSGFYKPELFALSVTLLAYALNAVLIVLKNIEVDFLKYGLAIGGGAVLIALGMLYRRSGRSENLSLGLVGAGIFILFTLALSMFNYLLLPLTSPLIDPILVKIDSMMGFSWPTFFTATAEYPTITTLLKLVYNSTMLQLTLLVVLLGLTGRQEALHKLLMLVVITGTLAICFWGLWPSFGTLAVHEMSPELMQRVSPTVDLEYRDSLMQIAENGPGFLTPNEVRGLIAFPSYHMVLALISVYAAASIRAIFPVFLVLNILMIPATIINGGHHLIDLIGGLAFFLFAVFVVRHYFAKHNNAQT